MGPIPDDEDWTWVLERPCPECGLDLRDLDVRRVPHLVRANAEAWDARLAAGGDLRARPDAKVWSTLEYACHVRDVLALYDARLSRMRHEDDPRFANWDQERAAVDERYSAQDPEVVRTALVSAADRLADAIDRIDPSELARPGRRSDGASFTVETLARYALHDPVHHLHDVMRAPPTKAPAAG